jgi:hypothetical protein
VGEGWEIGTVVTLLDGRPFTPGNGSRDRSGQDGGWNIHGDCDAPPIYHPRDPDNYLEASSFSAPNNGALGTCGRNRMVGPGLAQVDMSVLKTTRITENVKVQFRWEVFNAFNRPNYTIPVNNVRSGSFGTVTSTPDVYNPVISQGGARAMQWVLKVLF